MVNSEKNRESCPCCGGDEWKSIGFDDYGVMAFECCVCGFKVIA